MSSIRRMRHHRVLAVMLTVLASTVQARAQQPAASHRPADANRCGQLVTPDSRAAADPRRADSFDRGTDEAARRDQQDGRGKPATYCRARAEGIGVGATGAGTAQGDRADHSRPAGAGREGTERNHRVSRIVQDSWIRGVDPVRRAGPNPGRTQHRSARHRGSVRHILDPDRRHTRSRQAITDDAHGEPEPARDRFSNADRCGVPSRVSLGRLRRQQSQLSPAPCVRAVAGIPDRSHLVGILRSRGGARWPGLRGTERDLVVPSAWDPLDASVRQPLRVCVRARESVARHHGRSQASIRFPTSSHACDSTPRRSLPPSASSSVAGAIHRRRC